MPLSHDIKSIAVRSVSKRGRRRAGFRFGPEPTLLGPGDLTEEQAMAIAGDPELVVEMLDGADESPPAQTGASNSKTPPAGEPPEGAAAELGPDGAPGTGDGGTAGGGGNERQEALIAAIGGLDRKNKEHFTGAGVPQVDALKAATGFNDISAAERDTVWSIYQAKSDLAEKVG